MVQQASLEIATWGVPGSHWGGLPRWTPQPGAKLRESKFPRSSLAQLLTPQPFGRDGFTSSNAELVFDPGRGPEFMDAWGKSETLAVSFLTQPDFKQIDR